MKKISLVGTLAIGLATIAHSQALGGASNYNVFTTGDFTSQYSDTEGAIAAGGNVNLSGYSVAANAAKGLNLIAGKSLTFSGGTVNGTAEYGTTESISNATINGQVSANGKNPGATQGSPINFATLGTQLSNDSTAWANLAQNGTVSNYYGQLHLTATSTGVNVFNITASQLASSDEVDIFGSSSATYLINVSGSSVTFKNYGYNFNGSSIGDGAAASQILWNLSSATTVSANAMSGSILAMNANITTGYGAINGQVLAKSISGPDQINWSQFKGGLTPAAVPEPSTYAVFGLGLLGLAFGRRKRA